MFRQGFQFNIGNILNVTLKVCEGFMWNEEDTIYEKGLVQNNIHFANNRNYGANE